MLLFCGKPWDLLHNLWKMLYSSSDKIVLRSNHDSGPRTLM